MVQDLRMNSFTFSTLTDESESQVRLFAEEVVPAVRTSGYASCCLSQEGKGGGCGTVKTWREKCESNAPESDAPVLSPGKESTSCR